MGCNCGDNEYNITVDNNGNCEPTTPIYNITLANVGVNGYSPIVKFVNETVDSFNIAVDNITGTETSPAVPKLSYVTDQINNVNNTIANLGDTYLTVNGSNASSSFTINNLPIKAFGSGTKLGEEGDLYVLALQANDIRLQNYDYTNSLLASIQLSNGNVNIITNGIARYNSHEIATVNNIPTKTSDLTNDSGFITNSDIPTVGNGTITLTQGGVTKGTFTTNQSGNTTIELDAGGDITNKLDKDGSNADANISINGNTLASNGIYRGIGNINIGNKTTLGANSTSGYLRLPSFNLTAYDSGSTLNTSEPFYINGSNDTKVYYHGTLADNEIATIGQLPSVYNPTITFTQGGVTKGTITLNQSTNQTIALDAGGSGGGAVDSVNGQTGDVVLDASDVGALPDTTVIPTKTSDLTNDSNFATVSQIPTNNNQLTNGAGYLTSSDLTNYVTNSTLTTTLADYQPLLVSGTNIKTINSTSLLGSGNITVLANTASNNTSLTVGGTASTTAYSTNVGFGSQASASAAQAFGHYAIASGSYSLALGQGAEASNSYGIQIGKGTNSTAKSLSIGFGNNGNYQLLDGTTGLIPDARISSNIARSSNVANTDLSNLSTTGQAVIDGKVSKSGDTMTGALSIALSGDDTYNLIIQNDSIERFVTPSTQNQTRIQFVDKNGDDIGSIYYQQRTDGSSRLSQVLRNNLGNDAYAYIGYDQNGNTDCSFPNTKRVDGQWQFINTVIMDNVSVKGSSNLTYTLSDVPNDGHMYEVMLTGGIETGTTSGNFCPLQLRSDFSTGAVTRICSARTRSSSSMQAQGTVIIPLTSSRKIYVSRNSGWEGKANLWLIGYRRIGTNS